MRMVLGEPVKIQQWVRFADAEAAYFAALSAWRLMWSQAPHLVAFLHASEPDVAIV